jgi:hypothetical protein
MTPSRPPDDPLHKTTGTAGGSSVSMNAPSPDDAPDDEVSCSGQIRLRMPKTLHGELAVAADAEGVSLNQFMCEALAAAVKWRGSTPEDRGAQREEAVAQMWRDLLRS